MRIIKIDKRVIKVSNHAEQFLKGLTSNTLETPANAFLNLHGRIIATFDQVKSGDDEFLLVIAPQAWDALNVHVAKYARLSQTTFEPVEMNVYFDLDGKVQLNAGEYQIAQNKGRLILMHRALTGMISDGEFTRFRLNYNIPMHGIDYQDEMILNVHETNYVSYTKGCFLGQEPVAKVHHRSKPTWKLEICDAKDLTEEQRNKMTSKVQDPKTGAVKGFVFVSNA